MVPSPIMGFGDTVAAALFGFAKERLWKVSQINAKEVYVCQGKNPIHSLSNFQLKEIPDGKHGFNNGQGRHSSNAVIVHKMGQSGSNGHDGACYQTIIRDICYPKEGV